MNSSKLVGILGSHLELLDTAFLGRGYHRHCMSWIQRKRSVQVWENLDIVKFIGKKAKGKLVQTWRTDKASETKELWGRTTREENSGTMSRSSSVQGKQSLKLNKWDKGYNIVNKATSLWPDCCTSKTTPWWCAKKKAEKKKDDPKHLYTFYPPGRTGCRSWLLTLTGPNISYWSYLGEWTSRCNVCLSLCLSLFSSLPLSLPLSFPSFLPLVVW